MDDATILYIAFPCIFIGVCLFFGCLEPMTTRAADAEKGLSKGGKDGGMTFVGLWSAPTTTGGGGCGGCACGGGGDCGCGGGGCGGGS